MHTLKNHTTDPRPLGFIQPPLFNSRDSPSLIKPNTLFLNITHPTANGNWTSPEIHLPLSSHDKPITLFLNFTHTQHPTETAPPPTFIQHAPFSSCATRTGRIPPPKKTVSLNPDYPPGYVRLCVSTATQKGTHPRFVDTAQPGVVRKSADRSRWRPVMLSRCGCSSTPWLFWRPRSGWNSGWCSSSSGNVWILLAVCWVRVVAASRAGSSRDRGGVVGISGIFS